MEVNEHVPAYLARVKPMPRQAPDYFTDGGEDEAICYAAQFLPAWKETPGAAAWLRNTVKLSPPERPHKAQQPWSKVRLALKPLPQRTRETWELDLRAAAIEGRLESSWMVVAYNATDDQVLNVEFFDDRPKDAEVWSFLIATLRAPHDGEPRRPAVIRMQRKTWFRLWESKLRDIGVECHLSEPSVELDRWFETGAAGFEKAQQAANDSGPTEMEWSKLAALPQAPGEIWQAVMQQLPAWIQIAGEPKRPWVCLVAETASEAILATEIEMDEPTDDFLLKGVWHAMCSPAVGDAHRPATIHVATDRQQESIVKKLEPFDIQCVQKAVPEQFRQLIDELATHLGGAAAEGDGSFAGRHPCTSRQFFRGGRELLSCSTLEENTGRHYYSSRLRSVRQWPVVCGRHGAIGHGARIGFIRRHPIATHATYGATFRRRVRTTYIGNFRYVWRRVRPGPSGFRRGK